jgi:hypothetical protein
MFLDESIGTVMRTFKAMYNVLDLWCKGWISIDLMLVSTLHEISDFMLNDVLFLIIFDVFALDNTHIFSPIVWMAGFTT